MALNGRVLVLSKSIFWGLWLAVVAPYAWAADLQARDMAAACSACHGTYTGAKPGKASLAGVNKDIFTRNMMDFKHGRKPATLMHQLSKAYSDTQIERLADYFSALKQ